MIENIIILRGEGIECEEESFRAFKTLQLNPEYLYVQDLLRDNFLDPSKFNEKTLVVFPGGFSFADHFGSGRLLSFLLQEKKIFSTLLARGTHFLGICNGFQILSEANLFGENVRLRQNSSLTVRSGFENRWITCHTPEGKKMRLPVRHGEGRLEILGALAPQVKAFLYYDDFDNGSVDKIAGLHAPQVWGLMPHPECALWKRFDPNESALETMPRFREQFRTLPGDGVQLLNQILGRSL